MKLPPDKQMEFLQKMAKISKKVIGKPNANFQEVYGEMISEFKKLGVDTSELEKIFASSQAK